MNYLKIDYETLFLDYDATLIDIYNFFNIEAKPVQVSTLKKLNNDNLENWVSNLEEGLLKRSKGLV